MRKLQKIYVLLLFTVFTNCNEENTIGSVEVGEITGRVVKANSFEPIENAKITLSPTNNTTFTDANGDFIFEEAPINEYSVEASKEKFLNSFEPVSLESGASINVVFEMEISTALNNAPTTPKLISPKDGTIDLERSVELVWASSDIDKDSIFYRLEIKNDFNNDILKVGNLLDTTYVVSNLKFGRKYFWQIAATDNINPEVLSASSSFTILKDTGNRFVYVKVKDGNNIIYSSSLAANSTPVNTVQLTETTANSWRPRKNNTVNLIAFLKNFNNEVHIFTMKPDGSDVKRVTSNVPINTFNLNEVDFSWSATGDKFIYPSFDKLYMINKDGSGLQLIHQTTNGHLITECDWSNDENKIAIITNNSDGYDGSIYTIDTSGNLVTSIVSANDGALGGLNLSVDGNLLIYTKDVTSFQSSNYRRLDNRIFTYDFSTMTNTELQTQKEAGTNDLDPRFSPNEAEVIYVNSSNDGISLKTIFRIPIIGGAREGLFQDAIMPDWE
ncbi:carboxypeptidase regulatory-like domain-containing protein [Polaribacter sp. IC073]|uniref:carboxypeptidase regulatory-like domain-containing protein n=1 Tax=Polaribacter sp. IC073 TaxID=2508540 RepID=UPI0011BF753F|nr:carboxypeptidase regulatory-like domain-containing protein [Polaribacter sp. IC073]TXD45982.1 hypothetical protein ES045_15430 [Polaribacter sp. IC073]